MKRYLLPLLALAFLPSLLHANGDPVISYSARIRSCNPIPLKVTEVQVVREDLDINVALPFTTVRVAYRLKNNSKKAIHVDYGFPVDFSEIAKGAYGFEGDEISEDLYEVGVADRAVRAVKFQLDGTELPWSRSDEVVKTGETYEDEETGEIVEINRYRLWTYTVLDIPAGETVVMQVDYEILNNWTTPLGALHMSPLSRYFPSAGDFCYDFSPARHWGNGKADTFSCTLHCDGLPKTFFSEESPSLITEAPFVRFNKTTWTCNTANFDFKKAEELRLNFWMDNWTDPSIAYVPWGNPLVDCAIPAAAYSIKVSGAQANYPAANLSDGNLATAWVATGDGVGATIDIDFSKPRRVSDLGFYNGYHKSAALLGANSRVKTLRLEITRADGYRDEPVEIDVSDWDPCFYVLRGEPIARFGDLSLLSITNLDRMLNGRQTGVDPDGLILFDKVPFPSDYVSHIRLTILSVTPGTKYKDLCISDIVVLDGFED
ncbi:MAG: hypothetical protein IKG90_06445 [Bacteroidales bacterium]|nr:hypothetical protein [Bacteroidales bacterium]